MPTSGTRERLHYIDIAKGLLVLLVVIHHVVNVNRRLGVTNETLNFIDGQNEYYSSFFMQAFFFISGYSSNFAKPFKQFLLVNIKGLIFPFFSFGVFMYAVDAIVLGHTSLFIEVGDESYFYIFECSWFFTALFLAKLIQYIFDKNIENRYIQGLMWGGVILLTIASNHLFLDHPRPFHYLNHFHFKNGLCMGIFLWIGIIARKYQLIRYSGCVSVMFLLSYAIYKYIPYLHPIVFTHETSMGIYDIPNFLFFATSGSFFVMFLSLIIKENRILEYVGRNSVIVYGVQFAMIKISVSLTSSVYLLQEGLSTYLYYIIVSIESIVLSCLCIHLFMKTRLRYLIGRF